MFKLPFRKKKVIDLKPAVSGIRPAVLLVLDGWGIATPSEGNAIHRAKTPNMDRFYLEYPHGELIASGESVGLPANEGGNSEVGHLTLGSGRVILQSLMRINAAVEEGSFYDNRAFIKAALHVKNHGSKIHLVGLIGSGGVHSSIGHFYALLEFCRRKEINNVCAHLFTDGRDAPPQEGAGILGEIENKLKAGKIGNVVSVAGRYYAMDRDMRWERTQKAYEAIVMGKGHQASSAVEAVRAAYDKGQTDEFVEPTVIRNADCTSGTVDDNDAVIFFNFRVDRPRQLTMAFVLPDFEKIKSVVLGDDPHRMKREEKVFSGHTFKREKWPKNLFFATMTEYKKSLPVSAVAFPPVKAPVSLPQVLSENNLKQLHLTESEKERMVTTYFDGLNPSKFPGEDVIIVPSPKVGTYDKKPEMSVYQIVDEFYKQISKGIYNFVIMNFANPDMVAHSGSMKATIEAIEHVDKAVGMVTEAVRKVNGTLFITADHGNAEELLSFPTTSYFFTTTKGDMSTDHSNNPVPFIIVASEFKGKPVKFPRGSLSDVAPTILSWMNLPVPEQMTGKDLLSDLPVGGRNP